MKSILVFRSAALGDFILAAPALHEVRKNYPNREIVLLTIQSANKVQRAKVKEYVGNSNTLPWIELAMPHLIDKVIVLESLTDIRYLYGLHKSLSRYDFEAAILMLDPCALWLGRIKKMLLLFILLGPVPILGWRSYGSLSGNRKQLKKDGHLKHHVHGPLQFLSESNNFSYPNDADFVFNLIPGFEAEKWAETWINFNGLQNKRIIALAPGSIQPHKKWPIESFKILISEILDNYSDIEFVIIGTKNDKHLGEVLCYSSCKRIFDLTGKTSIVQSAALLKRCDLLVGNDGGAMHLGDAMGCHVVSIVPGIEYPNSIEPWHNKNLSVRNSVECSPCYNFLFCPEGHNKCMLDIPVDNVLSKCVKALNK
jgi:heptosyltransferase II